MKRISLIVAVLFTIILILITNAYAKYNLSEPEKKSIKINGRVCNFKLYKYDPPYLTPQYFYKDKSQQDLSTPEGTAIALASAYGTDTEWYLSLFDEESRKEQLRIDKETNGEYLKEFFKDELYPDAIKEGNYDELLYKIEFEYNEKLYAVTYENSYIDGDRACESQGSYSTYVKEKNKWLYTKDIEEHPLCWLAGFNTYNQLQQLCKKGYWFTPGFKKPPALKTTVTSSKKEYEYKEPFVFIIRIQNTWEDEPATIFAGFYPLGRSVKLEIESQENDISYSSSFIEDKNPTKEDFAILKPDEYKEATYKITEYLKPEDCTWGYPSGKYIIEEDSTVYFPPGEYTVQAEYFVGTSIRNNPVSPEGLLTGFWKSEPIIIKVLPGKEQRIEPEQPKTTPKQLSISEFSEDTTKEIDIKKQSTLYLKSGHPIKGEIIFEDNDSIKIKTDVIEYTVDKDEVDRIE